MSVPGWDLQRSNQIPVPAEYGRIIAWWMVGIVNDGMFVPGFLASSADRPICGERKTQWIPPRRPIFDHAAVPPIPRL
jgi:hypothetical protein